MTCTWDSLLKIPDFRFLLGQRANPRRVRCDVRSSSRRDERVAQADRSTCPDGWRPVRIAALMLGPCRSRIVIAAVATAVIALVAPVGAHAAPPKITSAPVIRGTA